MRPAFVMISYVFNKRGGIGHVIHRLQLHSLRPRLLARQTLTLILGEWYLSRQGRQLMASSAQRDRLLVRPIYIYIHNTALFSKYVLFS